MRSFFALMTKLNENKMNLWLFFARRVFFFRPLTSLTIWTRGRKLKRFHIRPPLAGGNAITISERENSFLE